MKASLGRIFKSKNSALFVFLIAILLFFSIVSEGSFISVVNIRSILGSTAIVGLLSIGASFVIISGQIDLSAGYVGTFCGILTAYLIVNVGWPWYIAVLCSLACAIVIGFVNASLVNKLGFQSFIATLAMGSVCEGLTYVVNGGRTITIKDPVFTSIGTARFFNNLVPSTLLFTIAALIIYGIILSRTRFGRKLFLIGGNPTAARLAGLSPTTISYIVFVNNAMLSCIAGCLVASRIMSGNTVGITAQNFSGITAAILGGVTFSGGGGSVSGIIVGLLIISSFSNGLTVMRVEPHWIQVASGVLLVFALTLDYIFKKGFRFRSNSKKAKTTV